MPFRFRVTSTPPIQEITRRMQGWPPAIILHFNTLFRAEWGPNSVAAGKALSPEDKLRGIDPRRRPSSQRFANQWRMDTALNLPGLTTTLDIGNIDPRKEFILAPTRAHIIPKGGRSAQEAKGYPMNYFWFNGPAGPGWYQSWRVSHPGTPGQPVHDDVITKMRYDRLTDDAIRRFKFF